jgi:predicted RNA-binding protein
MCESNAYYKKGSEEELIMGEVVRIDPVSGGFKLVGLLGDELTIQARLEEINLMKHKIFFVKDA